MVVVYMKKTGLILLAVILAFIITEIIVRNILNYPSYGIEKHIKGITTLSGRGEIYLPYSKYINVEGGNVKVFNRNNAGLPGCDINITDTSKYLLVLGNSFTEALQMEPESMAVTVFQRILDKSFPGYQVVNLGASSHDAYEQWFRVQYFEKAFPPEAVFLVLTDTGFFTKTDNFNFTLSPEFGVENKSAFKNILTFIRNKSSFINLTAAALRNSFKKDAGEEIKIIQNNTVSQIVNYNQISDSSKISLCLLEFKKRYDRKFIVISISGDELMNGIIMNFCKHNNINIKTYPLITSEYMLNGAGHFNEAGNKKLGEILNESFIEYIKK
jgi:hypothetical protein